jgi:hypothetical protein
LNQDLQTAIVNHILSCFAVIPSNFINLHSSLSLMSPEFLLKDKLQFDNGQKIIANKIWGCQLSVASQEIKILLGDCSSYLEDEIEFVMVVQAKDMPAYGLYLVIDGMDYHESLIACSLDNKSWIQCNTFLQATFLAAMEQVKDMGLSWKKLEQYTEQFQSMLSLIKFHTLTFQES